MRSRAQAKGEADALLEVSEDGLARRWPVEVEYVALMVAREAVANARQHAGASLIRVLLDGTETRLSVHVIDDGCGLPAALAHGRPGHLGVVGMRERAISIGARFDVEPSPSGGTSIGLHWQAPRT